MQKGSLKQKLRNGAKWWRAQWRDPGRANATTRWLGRCVDMTRDEAEHELKLILAPINGRAVSPQRAGVTLQYFVRSEYLSVKLRVWKPSTAGTTVQIIESHILTDLGNRMLATITRKELQAHLDRKAATGLSSSVMDHIRFQLQPIFEMAIGDGLITVNPTSGLVAPLCKSPGEKTVISPASVIRAQLELDIRDRLVFRLAVCEGLRPGEIVGLQPQDIHLDGLHISRRIYRGKVDTPKSKRGLRLMPPTPITKALLDQYLPLLPPTEPTGWLFASEAGTTPISYSNIYRRRLRPALKKVGLERVNFQVLRRTWVTEIAATEADPYVRAALAGHSVDVSENVYRRPKLEALREAMDKLGARLQ